VDLGAGITSKLPAIFFLVGFNFLKQDVFVLVTKINTLSYNDIIIEYVIAFLIPLIKSSPPETRLARVHYCM
jgi:hypothetical protein